MLIVCDFIGDELFVVMFGDDLNNINGDVELLIKELINFYEEIGVLILVVMWVLYEDIVKYGVINLSKEVMLGFYNVIFFVEKLELKDVLSDLVIIGCYVFMLEIFDVLVKIKLGKGNEI